MIITHPITKKLKNRSDKSPAMIAYYEMLEKLKPINFKKPKRKFWDCNYLNVQTTITRYSRLDFVETSIHHDTHLYEFTIIIHRDRREIYTQYHFRYIDHIAIRPDDTRRSGFEFDFENKEEFYNYLLEAVLYFKNEMK